MKSRLTYLAAPYSHKEHYMLSARFLAINQYAAKLMSAGEYIFSPISHTHPIAEAGAGGTPLPRGWDFWEGYDRRMLSVCDRIIVLRLPGWEKSTGVQAEIKIGQELGIPIEYVDYDCKPAYEDLVELACIMETPPTLAKYISEDHTAKSVSSDQKTVSFTLGPDTLFQYSTLVSPIN